MNSKTADTGKPLVNRPRAVSRQLVDQLKTAFIMGLLTLWLATLKSAPGKREGWWIFVILSVAVLVFWFVWRQRKGRSILRWWLPFVMLAVIEGLIWFTYWISGVSTNVFVLEIIGYILLAWAALLFSALFLFMFKCGKEGKLGKAISKVAEWGEAANAPLSVALLSSSVILGWSRLWSAGHRGLGMEVLLYLGVAMLFIVALAPSSSHNESDS